MKITNLFYLLPLLALSSCDFKDYIITKEGKGPINEKNVDVNFSELVVSEGISAEVVKSSSEKVVVSAPSDIIEEILVEQRGSKVRIHIEDNKRISLDRVSVKVYAKDFEKIEASSAAKISIKDKFTQENTEIQSSSAGSISGNLEANDFKIKTSSAGSFTGKVWAVDLDLAASSAGSVNIEGKTKTLKASVSSSGNIGGEKLVAQIADLNASSGASIAATVSSTLSANASSGGAIKVTSKGTLQVLKKEQSSGGSITITP